MLNPSFKIIKIPEWVFQETPTPLLQPQLSWHECPVIWDDSQYEIISQMTKKHVALKPAHHKLLKKIAWSFGSNTHHIQLNSYHIQVISATSELVSKHLFKKVCILTNGIIRIELIRDIGMIITRHTLAFCKERWELVILRWDTPWLINGTHSVPLDV